MWCTHTKIKVIIEIGAGELIHITVRNGAGAPESVWYSNVVYENQIDPPSQCGVPTPRSRGSLKSALENQFIRELGTVLVHQNQCGPSMWCMRTKLTYLVNVVYLHQDR